MTGVRSSMKLHHKLCCHSGFFPEQDQGDDTERCNIEPVDGDE
jgi:hypothetical protein